MLPGNARNNIGMYTPAVDQRMHVVDAETSCGYI